MAIQDRNLAIGTKLYARYKGTTHTAEVVEKEDAQAPLDSRFTTLYRLADGREFKSPSAAGTAVTGLACNGWAFWSVGDGSETTKSAKTAEAEAGSTITPAPKPQGKRRGRKGQSAEPPASDGAETAEPPASDGPVGDKARDDAPTAPEPDPQPVTCAECQETFPGVEARHGALLRDTRQARGRGHRVTSNLAQAKRAASKPGAASLVGRLLGRCVSVGRPFAQCDHQ